MATITATKKAATKKAVNMPSAARKRTTVNLKSMDKSPKNTAKTPFEKLFEDLLKDIYWAEQHLVDALQEMHEAATTEALKTAFEDHRHVTQKHVRRLEKVFSLIGMKAEAEKCDAMAGLIKEAQRVVKETEEGSMTRDAGLIIAAQKVEHYEIAAYGSLIQVALTLGHDDVATVLEQTLSDEEDADHHLTEIAETDVNPMADHEVENDNEAAEGSEEEHENEMETSKASKN